LQLLLNTKKYSAGTDKKRRYRRSDVVAELNARKR